MIYLALPIVATKYRGNGIWKEITPRNRNHFSALITVGTIIVNIAALITRCAAFQLTKHFIKY